MANKSTENLTNSQALNLVVGLTSGQAQQELAKLGYTCVVQSLQQNNDDSSLNTSQLVVGCNVDNNSVTLYLGSFILNPTGK